MSLVLTVATVDRSQSAVGDPAIQSLRRVSCPAWRLRMPPKKSAACRRQFGGSAECQPPAMILCAGAHLWPQRGADVAQEDTPLPTGGWTTHRSSPRAPAVEASAAAGSDGHPVRWS